MVDLPGQHPEPAGAHWVRRLASEEREIQVVDHQVEHHVDVGAALLESRQRSASM